MTEIIARRQFDPAYIWLDIAFLALYAALLIWKKKYATFIVGLIFGAVYMLVDYGIFHLLTHSRQIFNGYSMFAVLLWMSVSYGFTNFTWIWLWISKDKNLFEWSLLILVWWLCCPMLAQTFSWGAAPVIIQRTTGAYHGFMALILFAGYLMLIIWNMAQKKKETRVNIPRLLACGILVQLGWEAALLLGGIRSQALPASLMSAGRAGLETVWDKLLTLATNSLLETNLGLPYIYFIYIAFSARFTEQLKRRDKRVSFVERIAENNAI